MKHISCNVSGIISVLKEYMTDSRYTFVFNSDVVCNSWALWCVQNPDLSGTNAVDMERFIAWDEFTSRMVATKMDSKKAIDNTMRRMFATSLIAENACQPFLETVVSPAYSSDALYLAPTIAKRLPALNLWNKAEIARRKNNKDALNVSTEISDYGKIYDRYKDFMEKNGLFEPSWQDVCLNDGSLTDNSYILFYPIVLKDWVQYVDSLSTCENITVVDLPTSFYMDKPKAHLYPNARMEVRKTALHIRELLDRGENANLIALTVPDLPTLRPYVERELHLYDIPFVTRIGEKLSSIGVGRMFRAIYECYAQDFSLSAVRTLLQSSYVPWVSYKANRNGINWSTELVRIGSEMRCLCHYAINKAGNDKNRQKIDPWEEVFRNPHLEMERTWYHKLKGKVLSFVKARSFSEMRQAWFKWRDDLLDDEVFDKKCKKYNSKADAVLSQCVTVLYKLECLEKSLDGVKIDNPYEFFLNELDATLYSPQQDAVGVNVFDYKVSASASFKHNIVINASQDAVTVSYKTLDFLSEAYREKLLPEDIREGKDVSKEYLSLYNMNGEAEFSSSSDGFSGYNTPHSYLNIARCGKSLDTRAELDTNDFVTHEKECFLHGEVPSIISERQVREIGMWAKNAVPTAETVSASSRLQEAVFKALGSSDGVSFSCENPMQISATAMNNFFPCARKWLLKSVLKLSDEETFDTDLMPDYSAGNVLHKILEIFCKGYMDRREELPIVLGDGTFGDAEDEVRHQVEEAAKEAIKKVYDSSHSLISMPLVARAFVLQTSGYVKRIMNFLHIVCKELKIDGHGKEVGYLLGGKWVEDVEAQKTMPIDGAIYQLCGRLDCLLQTSSGDNIIIDYKSSSMPSIKASTLTDGEIEDFQMPMYVALLDGDVSEALFLSIKDGKDAMVVSTQKHPIGEYKATLTRLMDYVEHFASKVTSLDFSPQDTCDISSFKVWEECPPCPFNSICRKTFTPSMISNI